MHIYPNEYTSPGDELWANIPLVGRLNRALTRPEKPEKSGRDACISTLMKRWSVL